MTSKDDDEQNFPFDPTQIDWFESAGFEYSLFEKEWCRLKIECPTDADCIEELYNSLFPEEPPVCDCGSTSFIRKYGERIGKCQKCRKEKWFFSDFEYFKGFKKPRLYLLLFRAVCKGLVFNKTQLATGSEVYYSSAWNLLTKFSMACLPYVENAADAQEAEAAVFARLCTKRSSITPANVSPSAERAFENSEGSHSPDTGFQSSADHKNESEVSEEEEAMVNLRPIEKAAYAMVGTEPISFDQILDSLMQSDDILVSVPSLISALTVLELSGLITVLAGDLFIRAKTAPKQSTNLVLNTTAASMAILQSCINFIQAIFKGISWKYLQLHIAEFCRVVNFRAGKPLFSPSDVLRLTAEIAREEVKAFVSPSRVKILA